MTEVRRRAISTPGERRDPWRRGPGGVLLSVAIHLLALVLLVRIVIVPMGWTSLLDRSAKAIKVERIGFLQLPRSATPQREAPRSGGDNRAVSPTPVPPPIVAPTTVPSTIPAPPKKAPVAEEGGSGPLVGSGGPTRGVRPTFSDPRIWAPPAPVVTAPMSPKERLDSVIASDFSRYQDSLNALPHERAPGDWTFTHGGKKYGVDQKYIHLGDFSIPTALLALLPLNVQGNPAVAERAQRIGTMHNEIQEQSMRALRDDEFRAAVKALRERKEKERKEKKKADAPVDPDRPVVPDSNSADAPGAFPLP